MELCPWVQHTREEELGHWALACELLLEAGVWGSRSAIGFGKLQRSWPRPWVTLCACAWLQVAIKSIRKDKIKDEQDLVHIRREIEIMSSLNHPHIIAVHEGEPWSPLPIPAAPSGARYRSSSAAAGAALAALLSQLAPDRSCLQLPAPCR